MHSNNAVVHLLLAVMITCASTAHGSSVTDEMDTYHCVVTLQAGTANFNATADYTSAQLNTLTSQICSLVTPLLPAETANISSSCFVSYELTPLVEIHIPVATRGVSASYSAYTVLTGWTTAASFTPLANIRQRIFAAFGVPSASTTFVNASTTIPCRSLYTRPGATPAPTLGPLVCASNTTLVPVSQDLVLLTSSSISSSSLSAALCDVLGTTTCASVVIVSTNRQNTDYNLVANTIRISATLSGKMAAVLALVDATRRGLYPTLSTLQVQRVLLIPSEGVTGRNTSASVSLFHRNEGISPNSPPDVMVCNKFFSYWAFILLIFAPMFYIFFRQSYHAGRKKGIHLERQHMKEEEELREAEEQQREQQQLQQQGYHRSASQQLGASQTQQHVGEVDLGAAGTYPSQAPPPMDPSQWDPAMVAYVQQMLQQQQQQQQQQQSAVAH
jgi:hypothetical protein